jgi:hypothetical protein
MPIARALLKDVKPPISDTAIADSLWHYWFDVDKSVAWLRKDWEKKGTFIPSISFTTPPFITLWEQHPIYVYLSNTSDRTPAEPVRRSYDTGSFGTYARPTASPKGS